MYENSPIKASLTASMMVLVESLSEAINEKGNTVAKKIAAVNKQIKPYVATVEEYEKQQSSLRKNGFTRAVIEKPQNVELAEERISHAQVLIHGLRTLEAIEHLKFFGEDALLVRYDDFEKVMLAYDLRCTTLDRFTGQIPADKLNGLITIFDKMESLDLYWDKTINNLKYSSWPANPFPFQKSRIGNIRLFIVAPVTQIAQENKDPFVCAHTDYGILVLEKWGEEADHGIIKQYENTPLAYWQNTLQSLNEKANAGRKALTNNVWGPNPMELYHQELIQKLFGSEESTTSRAKQRNETDDDDFQMDASSIILYGLSILLLVAVAWRMLL